MAETAGVIELSFVHDKPDYYLIGNEQAHGKMFTNYTMSAVDPGITGDQQYVLELARFKGLPEAAALLALGWQRAVFVGKLATTSHASEQAELEECKTSDKKSLSPEGMQKLVGKKVGFGTGLFVVQEASEPAEHGIKAEDLSPGDVPQFVASVRNNDRRSLRIIRADLAEHYYDDQHGTKVQDLAVVGEDSWAAIEAFHRLLYDRVSDEIADRRLGEGANTQLRLLFE